MEGKRKAGRPPIAWDEAKAKRAFEYACIGTPFDAIAEEFGMDTKTLKKLYNKELQKGKNTAKIKGRYALYDEAVNKRNITALIFYCKTQLGMKELQENKISGELEITWQK